MQPEDKGTLKCVLCNNLTTRLIDGKPVCTQHFLEGWGRIEGKTLPPTMTPLRSPMEPELYVSDKPSRSKKIKRNRK